MKDLMTPKNSIHFREVPRGMGLPGVMMIITIMTILTMGVSSMVLGAFGKQKNTTITQTLSLLRERFANSIQSQAAWTQTFADPAFGCFGGANCPAGATAITTLFTEDNLGAVVPLYDTSVATNGFDVNGLPCDTFNPNPGNGSDACPIGYTMSWTPICDAGPCGGATVTPNIRVDIALIFNPENSGMFMAFNPDRYALQLNKNKVTNEMRVNFSETIATASAAAPTVSCGGNRLIVRMDDDFFLATDLGGGQFSFLTGTYLCRIVVPAYNAGSFSATLRNVTAGVDVARASGSTAVPNVGLWSGNSQASATIMANFKVVDPATVFEVRFNCQNSHNQAGGRPTIADNGLFPSLTQLSTMGCVRTD